MTFQIKDQNGNIVDKYLTYEDALLYTESLDGSYAMEIMKEDDRNDCGSL